MASEERRTSVPGMAGEFPGFEHNRELMESNEAPTTNRASDVQTRPQENREKGLERHHSRVPREALRISSPTNGGGYCVKGCTHQILMHLQSFCIG